MTAQNNGIAQDLAAGSDTIPNTRVSLRDNLGQASTLVDIRQCVEAQGGAGSIRRWLLPVLRSNRHWVLAGLILAIATAVLAQATPLILKSLTDQVAALAGTELAPSRIRSVLIASAGYLLITGILRVITEWGLRQVGERLKVATEKQLSDAGGRHLLDLDMSSIGGSIEERTTKVQRSERGAEGIAKIGKTICIDLMPTLLSAALAIIIMIRLNPWVGIIAGATVPLYVALAMVQGSKQAGVREAIKDAREKRFSSLLRTVLSLEIVQSYAQQYLETRRHAERSATLAKQENRHHLINHVCDSLKLGIDEVGSMLVVLASFYLVLQGQLTIGAVVLYLGLYRNVSAPIRELHRVYTEYQEATILSRGLFEVLEIESKITSKPDAIVLPDPTLAGRTVRLERVSFGYPDGPLVLHNIDIELLPGQTTALVGASGAGKSTIASLLSRLYDPSEGKMLFDGVDARDLDLDWLRQQVGFVTQSSFVTSGSIGENIRYGCPSAKDADLVAASQRAGLLDVLKHSPFGLDTPVDHLSGGERQRVALARVFLKDPQVLILDEPTANLDALNVERIAETIDELRRNRTVLVIAHDPGLFMTASRIYVLEQGRIVERGTHESLRHAGGEYDRIIDANITGRRLLQLVDGHSERLTSTANEHLQVAVG